MELQLLEGEEIALEDKHWGAWRKLILTNIRLVILEKKGLFSPSWEIDKEYPLESIDEAYVETKGFLYAGSDLKLRLKDGNSVVIPVVVGGEAFGPGPEFAEKAVCDRWASAINHRVMKRSTVQLGKATKCPECKTGYIEIVEGEFGPFYSCSNYPYCRYKPLRCPKCENGFLELDGNSQYSCVNDYCGFKAQVCPGCNEGYMLKRTGPYPDFLGCSNFPDCRYKE